MPHKIPIKKNFFKIVICGDGAVGKTTISKKLTGRLSSEEKIEMTPGIDFHGLMLEKDDKKIFCQLWDLGGQHHFRDFQDNFFESASIVIFVCSVDRFQTLENIESWLKFLPKEKINKSYLVANKIDFQDRSVKTESIIKLAKDLNLEYYEVSARTGDGFDKFESKLIEAIYKIYDDLNK